jgi:hypothetical protein
MDKGQQETAINPASYEILKIIEEIAITSAGISEKANRICRSDDEGIEEGQVSPECKDFTTKSLLALGEIRERLDRANGLLANFIG